MQHVETENLLTELSRKDFTALITKLLYRKLENFLKENFEQWEGWFYIHKFFEVDEDLITKQVTDSSDFDQIFPTLVVSDQLHTFKYNEEKVFIPQKRDYKIMKITPSLYELLEYFKTPVRARKHEVLDTGNQIANWSVIQELIDLNFIKQIA